MSVLDTHQLRHTDSWLLQKLRAELKRICHDIQIPCRETTRERLKEECRDIGKIVATEADKSSLKVCHDISKLFHNNS